MLNKKISRLIEEACHKEGIDYKSNHIFCLDAQRLGEIWLEIESFADELNIIADRHKLESIKNLLHDDLELISKLEHDLCNVALKIKEEQKLIKLRKLK